MSDLEANLTLSVFLTHFREQLVKYRFSTAIDLATPQEILGFVIDSMDRALVFTKGSQKEQRPF